MTDDNPAIEIATAIAHQEGEGLTFEAMAASWLSLLSDEDIAACLYSASDAIELLAETFGPRPDAEPAPVVRLVTDKGD